MFDPSMSIYSLSTWGRPDFLSTVSFPLGKKGKMPDEESLKKVCREFESIFLTYLVRQMRKAIPKSDFLEGGLAGEFYRDQWDQVLAEKMTEGGGIGLAKILYQQLQKSGGKY